METTPRYLIMVTTENNNKYYRVTPLGDGTFKAEWGRVGLSPSSKIYPMSKYNSLINSKIKKGYVDQTDLMQEVIEDSKVEDNSNNDEFSTILNDKVRQIIKRLFNYANQVVQSSYRVSSNVVTQAMVDKAQEQLDKMAQDIKSNNLSVEDFNKELVVLFSIIPRSMGHVSDHLSNNNDQFEKILAREQSILDTMAGQVYKPNHNTVMTSKTPDTQNMLEKMGIEMEPVENSNEINMLKKAMGNQASKFYQAWRVKNIETEENYDKFTKENNIGNVRLLCHGSRNQNWFNILKMGLKIRPAGAGYNGSMFGDGIYWSNPDKFVGGVQKSIGYTSLGGYWTRDFQDCGFIAFFDVALGDPYYVPHSDSSLNLEKIRKMGKNVWHTMAVGGKAGVINDELIVYNDKQMTVRYLVEIRNN